MSKQLITMACLKTFTQPIDQRQATQKDLLNMAKQQYVRTFPTNTNQI